MNQILDFGEGNNDNNNGGKKQKPIKEKKNKAVDNSNNSFNGGFGRNNNYAKNTDKAPLSDKIVKVFALLMVIFAVALIASGVMSILKNKKDSTKNTNTTAAPQVKAEIKAELNESTGKVKIKITSPIAISKMIYSWDQDHDNVVAGEKQTTIEEDVIAPYGEHVLHVQVIDEQNNKTTDEFTINSETGMDTNQPEITLTITEDKKLLVTATDDTSIAYVTYTWNEEEVVTMTPEDENLKKYEFEVDIPRGKNTIVVVAVDGSESSNARTTSKVLEGVTKPEINYGFLDSTGSVLQIMCSHENGIKSIYYTLNGQAYQWESPEGDEAPKELSFTQESVVGHNEMTIKVTSVDDTVAEFNPAWDYLSTPPTEEIGADNNTNESTSNTTSEDSINN